VRPSAAELTARGRTYLARHRDADNELAVSLFRRALGAADAGPAARVGLSLAYSQRATKFNRAPAWAEDAERLARQALDTRRDAEGYHAFGLALDAQGRVSPALAAYRRAAELDPGHAGAIASAAYLLAVRGELAEALRWDLEALRLDADLPYVEIQIAEVLATLGHATAADVWFRRALALRPDNVFVHGSFARQRLRRGDVAGAEDLAHAAVERGVRRPEPLMILGHAAWMRGRGGEALRHYRRAEALNARQSGAAAYLAALAAGRHRPGNGATPRPPCRPPQQGELDEWPDAAVSSALDCIAAGDRTGALAGLDAAIARGFRDAKWLRLHPAFAPLRGDPGFAARCARIRGLVAAEERRLRNADWLPSGLFGPRPSLTAPCRRRRSPAGGARRGSRRPARASTVR
jgi:tetratricopeptide (TPR) repeat protein